jgi:hypothetical protein
MGLFFTTNTNRGKLTLLGNAVISKGKTTYSVIEIGDTTLNKISCGDKLDNYLSRALSHQGEVELETRKPTILMMLIMMGITMTLIGLPIFLLYNAYLKDFSIRAVSIDGKRYTN